jgi:hypothetical protein
MLLADCDETVVLVLKDVVFRYTAAKLLSDFLIEKYGFIQEENKIKETAKSKTALQQEKTGNIYPSSEQKLEETRKYSTTKILSGNFSDAKIIIHILGLLVQKEDAVEINGEENYKVYNSQYQLIKIASKSGYAINRFIEQLNVDVGLEIKSKDWFFHRSNNA